jgi:hypothetical protein
MELKISTLMQNKPKIKIFSHAHLSRLTYSTPTSFFLGYWHCGHSWPIVPVSGDSDCGEADGM